MISFEGSVEKTVLTYIIRDHDRDRFERRKKELEHLTRKINNEFPGCASIEINDQYYNMREKVEPVMHIVDLVSEAMRAVDVVPMVKPVRGGTDGAQLSFKGLPCPNIFAGGLNFHGRYGFVPIQSMEKSYRGDCANCQNGSREVIIFVGFGQIWKLFSISVPLFHSEKFMSGTLIVLTGPTGVGKTELSLQLAERYACPIVSADSRQFYGDIPIGTAAPYNRATVEGRTLFRRAVGVV